MKKTLVLLMAAAVISIGAAQAATSTTEGPVTKWLNNATSKVSKTEQSTYQKAQAKKQKAEAKKKKAEAKQAENEKKLQQKKTEAQNKKNSAKSTVETKKKQWKELLNLDD